MVDYIADYLETIRTRRVYPAVSPGYLRNILPISAPVEGEPWENIFEDIERCIMPGVTHWQSPHMHAYFPALNSPASLLADMLADAINCLGFTWVNIIFLSFISFSFFFAILNFWNCFAIFAKLVFFVSFSIFGPHSTVMLKEYFENISLKSCNIAKIFIKLLKRFLKYCRYLAISVQIIINGIFLQY